LTHLTFLLKWFIIFNICFCYDNSWNAAHLTLDNNNNKAIHICFFVVNISRSSDLSIFDQGIINYHNLKIYHNFVLFCFVCLKKPHIYSGWMVLLSPGGTFFAHLATWVYLHQFSLFHVVFKTFLVKYQ
jgi:hypothetical protein